MNTLLLAPHFDDEVLFASFTLLQHRPDVWWVFQPQDPNACAGRRMESEAALRALGVDHQISTRAIGAFEGEGASLSLPDQLRLMVPPQDIMDRVPGMKYVDHVFAPTPYNADGHPEHDSVGLAALQVFGAHRVTLYHTYRRQGDRVKGGRELRVTPGMIQAKLRALACFESQIHGDGSRPWFYDLLEMREWYA